MESVNVQAILASFWQAVKTPFLTPEWTLVHSFMLIIVALTGAMWLIAPWPRQVKILNSFGSALVMFAMLLSIGAVTPGQRLHAVETNVAQAESAAQRVLQRMLEPVASIGRGAAGATRSVGDGIGSALRRSPAS